MLIVESTLSTWSALFDLLFAFGYFFKTQEVVFLVFFVSPYISRNQKCYLPWGMIWVMDSIPWVRCASGNVLSLWSGECIDICMITSKLESSWADIVDIDCSLWPLNQFRLFLQNSRSDISYFRIAVFLVIRIVIFHFTPRIPTVLLWPSASATCIYGIDNELQGIALNWHHQSYWVGIIISQSHTSKVSQICRMYRHRDTGTHRPDPRDTWVR